MTDGSNDQPLSGNGLPARINVRNLNGSVCVFQIQMFVFRIPTVCISVIRHLEMKIFNFVLQLFRMLVINTVLPYIFQTKMNQYSASGI